MIKVFDMVTPIVRNWYVQWFVVGLLMALPFVWPGLWWSAIMGIAGYLYVLTTHHAPTHRQLVLGGILVGAVQYLGVLSWVWSTYPLEWLAITPFEAAVLLAVYTLVAVIVLGASKVLVLYAYRYMPGIFIYLFPLWWLVSEVLAAGLFSLHALGAGGGFSLHFSYGMVGYVLAEHGLLLETAAVVGVYGLSIVAVWLGVMLYSIVRYVERYRYVAVVLFVGLLLVSAQYTIERDYDDSVRVSALETSFDRRVMTIQELVLRQRSLVQGVVAALQQGNQYVVLPEDVRFGALFSDEDEVFAFIRQYATAEEVVLVDSSRVDYDDVAYVRAYMYDTQTNQVYSVDKQQLVPQGEYMPYLHGAILRLFGYGEAVDSFAAAYNYVPGPLVSQSELPDHLPLVLFCYESSSPYALQQLVSARSAPFVAHPVSHSAFNHPLILSQQLEQMLQVNARFAGVVVYQSGNMAPAKRF